MSELKRKFKGVWITAEIWKCKDLTPSEKCFIAEIDSLSDGEDDPCFASNQYLSEMFQLSVGRIKNIISSLKQRGFINVKFEGKKRFIWIADRHKVVTVASQSRDGDRHKVVTVEDAPNKKEIKELEKSEASGADAPAVIAAKERHKEFVKLWAESFESTFGEKYRFTPQDGAALKRFVAAVDLSAEEIFAVAQAAWVARKDKRKFFKCGMSSSIMSFLKWFNDIKGELRENFQLVSAQVRPDRDWNKIFGTP